VTFPSLAVVARNARGHDRREFIIRCGGAPGNRLIGTPSLGCAPLDVGRAIRGVKRGPADNESNDEA
jgi:hypothetical protein